MSPSLSNILKSQSHFLTLEVLALRESPCHLRNISRLTNLHIHSIENTVKDLCSKKVLTRIKKGRFVLFKLNSSHPHSKTLQKIFSLISQEKLLSETNQYHQKAIRVLKFIDSSNQLFQAVKKK